MSTARALALPAAQRHQESVARLDFDLTAAARLRRPAVVWWWGERNHEGRFGALCYLCDELIATWARAYPITQAARSQIIRHRDERHSLARITNGTNAGVKSAPDDASTNGRLGE